MQTRDRDIDGIHQSLRNYTSNVTAAKKRNTTHHGRLAVVFIAAAFFFFIAVRTARSAPADYSFHQIAFSGDVFDPFGFEAPALNNAGFVAFNASRTNGQSAILRGNGGPLTTIAVEDRFRRFGSPSINPSGQVGFEASFRNISGEGIFRGDGGPITTVAGTRDAGTFDFVNARPSLNASPSAAFIGERIVEDSFIDGVYAGDGGAVAAIYDATGPFADFTGNPSLNDCGQAAFLATLDSGVRSFERASAASGS